MELLVNILPRNCKSESTVDLDRVWSLSCMLYALLTGRPPFNTDKVTTTFTEVVFADYEMLTIFFPKGVEL